MKNLKIFITIIYCLLCVNVLSADEFSSTFDRTKSKVGFYLYDLNLNRIVSSYKDTRALKPASLLKIVTSYASLKALGNEYTFSTKIYVEGRKKDYVKRLIVVGGGDPSFDINSLWEVARQVKEAGINEIGKVVLDNSFYSNNNLEREGQRAYQAVASSISLNYNSVKINVCPNVIGHSAIITNSPFEYQVNFNGNIISNQKKNYYSIDESLDVPNAYNVSGSIRSDIPCESFYRNVKDPLLYFTQVFYKFLLYLDIDVSSKFLSGIKGDNAELLFDYRSKPLKEILIGLNHYSTNVTANHLVYALGDYGVGASFLNGLQVLNKVIKDFGCGGECRVYDGSGLDHNDFISSKTLGNILVRISKDPSIAVEFESSLPTMSKSGTLKRIKYLPSSVILRAKTGTIDGVRGLAGYIYSQKGKKYVFVLMQNNTTYQTAMNLEKKVINLINNRINR